MWEPRPFGLKSCGAVVRTCFSQMPMTYATSAMLHMVSGAA